MTARESQGGEAQIRAHIDDRVKALRAKDIDTLVPAYAPTVVLFDVVNPLRSSGAEAIRKRLEDWFSTFQGPVASKFAICKS